MAEINVAATRMQIWHATSSKKDRERGVRKDKRKEKRRQCETTDMMTQIEGVFSFGSDCQQLTGLYAITADHCKPQSLLENAIIGPACGMQWETNAHQSLMSMALMA